MNGRHILNKKSLKLLEFKNMYIIQIFKTAFIFITKAERKTNKIIETWDSDWAKCLIFGKFGLGIGRI